MQILRQQKDLPNHIFKILKMEQIFDDSQQFFVELEAFLVIGIKIFYTTF